MIESQRDAAIEALILRLSSRNDWRESAQGKYFAATMFPFLNLCRRLAIREHLWDSYQQLRERLIKIEAVLARNLNSLKLCCQFPIAADYDGGSSLHPQSLREQEEVRWILVLRKP